MWGSGRGEDSEVRETNGEFLDKTKTWKGNSMREVRERS